MDWSRSSSFSASQSPNRAPSFHRNRWTSQQGRRVLSTSKSISFIHSKHQKRSSNSSWRFLWDIAIRNPLGDDMYCIGHCFSEGHRFSGRQIEPQHWRTARRWFCDGQSRAQHHGVYGALSCDQWYSNLSKLEKLGQFCQHMNFKNEPMSFARPLGLLEEKLINYKVVPQS